MAPIAGPPETSRAALYGSVDATFRPSARGLSMSARVSPPLELRGPFIEDGCAPRYFLRNVTAGVFGGDRYDVRIRAEAGARVRVQPTSATRAYESRGATATASTSLEAHAGAELTYDAGTTILQQGSCLEQSVELVAHAGGRLRYVEVLALGRLASAERLQFVRFTSSLRVRDAAGRELYREAFRLGPGDEGALLDAAVGGAGVVGTLVLLGGPQDIDVGSLASEHAVFVGASALPRGDGVIVRVLGGGVEAVTRVLACVLDSHTHL